MTDGCEIETGIEDVVTVEVVLDSVPEVSAAIEFVAEVETAVETVAVSVDLEGVQEILAQCDVAPEVVAAIAQVLELEVEVVEDVLSAYLIDKLVGLRYPEKKQELIKLAYATGKSLAGSGEAGDQVGDSTKWVGTDTYQEIAQCTILQPAWRNQGKVEFDITAEFLNSIGGGVETMSFLLEAGSDYPANGGLPPSWTTVAEFTSQALANAVGLGTLFFTIRICAEGHQGDDFFQAYKASMTVRDRTTGSCTEIPFTDRISLDTTEDLVLRWSFKASVAPDLPDQKFNVTHLSAKLELPDEFHPYP